MLRFWELAPSPNNTKVRMALRYKRLHFEAIPVDPFDRGPVREISGQDLTPVIADSDVVLNDSEAILQYLDANYRESPRLFPSDRAGRRTCDEWERTLAERVVAPWLPVFLHAIGRQEQLEPGAAQRFRDALGWLEQELGERAAFKDPEMPVCDLRVAVWATYALPGARLLERVPLFGKFQRLYGVDAGQFPALERFLAPWQERLG